MAKRTKKPHRARRLVLVLAALLLGALIRGNVSLQTETFTCRSAHLPEGFDGFTAAANVQEYLNGNSAAFSLSHS